MARDEALITGDATKLPPDVAALLDSAVALPSDVRLFETRFDLAHVSRTLLIAAGFALATIVLLPIGVALLFEHNPTGRGAISLAPLGFGLLCGFVTWVMLQSAGVCWGLRDRQLRGQSTRRGTFLTADELIQATESDTTIIPRARFRGIERETIAYEFNGTPKTFRLPAGVVDATPADRHAAIAAWAGRSVAMPPPMIR